MKQYKLIANGTVSFPRWELSAMCFDDSDAIKYAKNVVATFLGCPSFIRLDIWQIESKEQHAVEGENLIGSVYLRTEPVYKENI